MKSFESTLTFRHQKPPPYIRAKRTHEPHSNLIRAHPPPQYFCPTKPAHPFCTPSLCLFFFFSSIVRARCKGFLRAAKVLNAVSNVSYVRRSFAKEVEQGCLRGYSSAARGYIRTRATNKRHPSLRGSIHEWCGLNKDNQ